MDEVEQDYLDSYRSDGIKSLSDSRKPIITLTHLNKLKKLKQIREKELSKRKSLLSAMYGKPKETEGGL